MTLSERIREIANHEHLSIRAFEKSIGASDGVISKSLRSGTDISAKWLLSIVEKFPHYNLNWLMTGEGPMLGQETSGDLTIPKELAQMFSDMAATIRSQQEELRGFRSNQIIK